MDVKPWVKVVVGIMLSFMIVFTSIGYAAVTDSFAVKGTVEIDIPYGLFITDIQVKGTPENIDHYVVEFLPYTTTVDTIIDKKDDERRWTGRKYETVTYTGEITFEITVYNNTQYEYAYRDLYYQKTQYHNTYVSTTPSGTKIGVVENFPNGTIVQPGKSLVFEVTYTIGNNSSMTSTNDWRTLLNYQFGINVNSIDKAADIVIAKFLDILNTSVTYNELYEKIDDKFDGNQEWTSNYIGNVGNAVDADMMTVETLFAGQLTMMVNGKPQKAWVLIKHENVDENEQTGDDYTLNYNNIGQVTHRGCEMTLYLTVDKLDKANGWAPVYATVFTCDRDEAGNIVSDWYMIGDTYYGQANIVGYRGEGGGTGSFVTDNWKSYSGTYQVTDRYSYRINADLPIENLMGAVDQAAINEFQRLLTDAEAMIANEKYAGTGIKVVEEAYARAAKYYTLDANGKAVANAGTRRVWLTPIMSDLDYVLGVAQDAIDKIEQGG